MIDQPPIIKYRVIKNGKVQGCSYSQVHDEFLNFNGTGLEQAITAKIQKDIKFYTQNKINEDHTVIKVYINNEFKEEYLI